MTNLFAGVVTLVLIASLSKPIAAQELLVEPDHASGIYRKGEKIGWTISVAAGQHASPGLYRYTVLENGLVPVAQGTIDLSAGRARIETKSTRAAMLWVDITLPEGATQRLGDASTGGIGHVRLGAAVDPTHIQRADKRPADFNAFWTRKRAELKTIPLNAEVIPTESGVAGVDYFTVRLDNVQGAHVYGQLAKPSGPGPFPAMVQLQYAGVYPLQKQWVTSRAAQGWLVLNISAHDLPGDMPQSFYDALPAMLKSYNSIYDFDRDRNYFLRMYLGDVRAVDYLAIRPEWNGRTLVAFGESMGGQQSLALAGLDKRITHVVVNIPAGADANALLHGHVAGYPNWDSKNPRVAATAPYFDVVNFASRIRAPVMMSIGFIDEVTPPTGQWAAFNQIPGVKEVVPMINSNHGNLAKPEHLAAWRKRSKEWLDALVRGDPVPPRSNQDN